MLQKLRTRLFKQRRFRILLIAVFTVAVCIGLLIVRIEKNVPGTHYHSNLDGIYWAMSTLTTVGYGDVVPITATGKFLAMMMQFLGAVLFGLIIGTIVANTNQILDEYYWNRLFGRLDDLESEIAELKKKSDFLVQDASQPKKK